MSLEREDRLAAAEDALLDRFAAQVDTSEIPIVSILASPRTGSTLVYQLLGACFDFWSFSNLVNDAFAERPIVGAALEMRLRELLDAPALSLSSAYGKTDGIFGVSEASAVMRTWFGGEHPSETRSARVLPGAETHLLRTMAGLSAMTGRAVLLKNAWNCFRVGEWARLFPAIRFVHVRRDLVASALSDLEARYRRGGPEIWSSATTANHEKIRERPYWEQVAEVQYEYQRRLEADLSEQTPERSIEIWYEDICERTEATLARIERFFTSGAGAALDRRGPMIRRRSREAPPLRTSPGASVSEEDRRRVQEYVASDARFLPYLRRAND